MMQMMFMMGPIAVIAIAILGYIFFYTDYSWLVLVYFAWYFYDLESRRNGGWSEDKL